MSATIAGFGLLLAPGLPLLFVALWCIPGQRTRIGRWMPWAALPALVLAIGGATGAAMQLDWVLFGLVLGLDELRRVFLVFTAMVWLGAGIHARAYLAADARSGTFCLLWLITMAGNFGLIVSRDVAGFYASFALMTFAAYGLVIHNRTGEALRAGRIYLIMAVIGEALILSGLILASMGLEEPLKPMLADIPGAIAGSPLRDLVVTLLFSGFGIKAGLPLLHMWLPLAHPVAPIPASAVLSGAMIKAGLLGWMTTLPFGLASMPHWSMAIMGIGLFGAFAAAVVGIQQRTPKTVLAYSSISQMGLITVGVGAGLHEPDLWRALAPAIAVFALHHGLAKGALFLGVSIARARGGHRIGAGLWLALALPGLSLCGPMVSGMAAKLSLKAALAAGTVVPAWWQHLPLLLSVAAIGTTGLVARYLWLLRATEAHADRSATRGVWLGWAVLWGASTFGLVALPWLPVPAGWPPDMSYLPGLLWPVIVGVVIAALATRHLRPWPIPAGDIVVPLERVSAATARAWRRVQVMLRRRLGRGRHHKPRDSRLPSRAVLLGKVVQDLWRRESGLVFVVLLMAMLLATLL